MCLHRRCRVTLTGMNSVAFKLCIKYNTKNLVVTCMRVLMWHYHILCGEKIRIFCKTLVQSHKNEKFWSIAAKDLFILAELPMYDFLTKFLSFTLGEAGPCAVCPFGFQSKLASAGFSPGTPVFLLHLKLDFFLDYCLFLFVQRALLESSACLLSKATLYKYA